jgi:LacI family transcriptional regulator
MTRHLVELGHRDIGFISGPYTHLSSHKRQEAFVRALASHGLELPSDKVTEGEYTFDSGVIAANKLLSHKRRPTAIFAANDEMAFGVLKVAHQLGVKIPEIRCTNPVDDHPADRTDGAARNAKNTGADR